MIKEILKTIYIGSKELIKRIKRKIKKIKKEYIEFLIKE